METNKIIKIFCDGGSRGNPGPAAAAFVVEDGGKVIAKGSKFLGVATNNVAEYSAVVLALSWLENNSVKNDQNVVIILDSELVSKQMSGLFKIKNENLRSYFLSAKKIERKIGAKVTYETVRRTKNILADHLVNQTLDSVNENN